MLFSETTEGNKARKWRNVLSKPGNKIKFKKKGNFGSLCGTGHLFFHINTPVANTRGPGHAGWIFITLSACIRNLLPRSSPCPANANALVQGFCIAHSSMPTLSSHPSGTDASPTRSTGAVAVPAHLSPALELLCQTTTVSQ